MKQTTFNIRTDDGTEEKTGYRFIYPDYRDYEFAVHQQDNSINSEKRWIVTELSTGLAIGGNNWQKGKTRKAAISEAKEILDRVGKAALDKRVAETISQHYAIVSGRAN